MANDKATPSRPKDAPKDGRTRIWAAVVYPDSAPVNWQDLLDEQLIEWAESPLHDRDVNPGTGELKKPHWHIVLAFEGKKSFEQVCAILEPLHCPIPQRCHALKGAVRYMAHLDNPEKAQYPVSAIKGHGGFDVTHALAPSSAQRYEIVAEMMRWCKDQSITEMQDLMDYAASERYEDWFPLLCDSCCMVMSAYIKSARHRIDPGKKNKVRAAGKALAAAALDQTDECLYGWVECPYWRPGDKCLAPDQGPDYCPCFDPSSSFGEI